MLRRTTDKCVESLKTAHSITHHAKDSLTLFESMMKQAMSDGRTVLDAYAVADAGDANVCVKMGMYDKDVK